MEDKVAENTQSEQQKENRIQKSEESLRVVWNNIKLNNICIIGVPEGEESKQVIENLFEEIMTNFPNLMKEKDKSRRSESPPKDELKLAHIKAHHN